MAMEALAKYVDKLSGLLKEPPYLLFVFIGAVFVFISLVLQESFEQTWTFFLYSAGGTMWRYVERDVRHNVLKTENSRKTSIVIYHIGNIGLFFTLIYYLGFI